MFARRKGSGDARRVIGLAGPFLGAGAEHGGKPRPRLLGIHRMVAGRRVGGRLLPFLEVPPDLEAVEWLGGRLGRLRPLARRQRRDDGATPRPAAKRHRPGDGQGIGGGWIAGIGEAGEQSMGDGVEGRRFLLERPRQGQAQRLGEAARRRQAEAGRVGEGIELEHVEGGEGCRVEAPRRGAPVTDHGDRPFPDAARRLGEVETLNLAVGGQPDGAARPRRHGGDAGQEDARADFRGVVHGAV